MELVYKCDYCNCIKTKELMEAHEKICEKNPNNKMCVSCLFYTYKMKNSHFIYICKNSNNTSKDFTYQQKNCKGWKKK